MTLSSKKIKEEPTASDNVHVRSYDVAILRYLEPCWDALPDIAKLDSLRDMDVQPAEERHTHNTVCIELDEFRAKTLNEALPTTSTSATDIHVGDGSTTPAYTNRSLNNFVVSVDIAEYETSGTDLILNAVVGTEQANNAANDLQEAGIVTEDGHFLNHSLFAPVTKSNQRSVVIEATLTFDNS